MSTTARIIPLLRKYFVLVVLVLASGCTLPLQEELVHAQTSPPNVNILLPQAKDGLRFAVIGDSGTGGEPQYGIGRLMETYRQSFDFKFVLMMGDNLYGSEGPGDYDTKFAKPYKALLDAGVKFYASLGNHDDPTQRQYALFNMNGRRYYTFQPKDGIRLFALDSNYMDPDQLKWLENELRGSESGWKICFFHHPIYSSGKRHGSDLELRSVLEPLFIKYGVDVVFAGHEHFYERLKPQHDITYFISGAAAKLRRGGVEQSALTAQGFDQDYSFMLLEIAGDEMHFQTVSLANKIVDQGVITRREVRPATSKTQTSNGSQ